LVKKPIFTAANNHKLMPKKTLFVLLALLTAFAVNKAFAQPGWTFDPFGKEKKPEKFENRKLGSEKTADKKFTKPRRLLQNTITHYNYFYNANNKLNGVLERAKLASTDDYTKLLPFHPFSLTNTASQKQELDSVIYKCTAGILLHDLRNDWVDNLYLLIGKAYYYRQDFDSAAMTLQFINYNLFPRKKGEEDSRVVGGNESATASNISIANREKRNLLQKVASLPPSRNDALIWLARTLIEQNELGESAGLINTLQNDANLPQRLRNDLSEVNAYWYYQQQIFDSAAVHLEKAITNADDKQDKSRREFLLAQLYEIIGYTDKASDYYAKASKHTVDPLLDIYAQLNNAKLLPKDADGKQLKNSIANLLKMAKKDKFEAYRDIVLYSAGQLAMALPDTASAVIFFNKSIEKNENNVVYRNKAYLQLADIAYSRKAYKLSAAMYDSLRLTGDTTLTASLATLQARTAALKKIVDHIITIETQDSLQRIAALPTAEREDFVKKLLRKLRKESGLKDEATNTGNVGGNLPNNNAPTDLFASTGGRGEWYFYNASLKGRGFNEFKAKWGNRVNVDNWRRKAAMDIVIRGGSTNSPNGVDNTPNTGTLDAANTVTELSFDGLMQQLPLTQPQVDSSNTLIAANLLSLAKVYQSDLEDYEAAIKTYEDYLTRFPASVEKADVYLGLYYCYNKLGNKEQAAYYKNLLNKNFANTKAWQKLNTPEALNTKNPQATKKYEDIYNLFIEGNFTKAIEEKKSADTQFGENYWTPQLLYIEALYNVKEKNDSVAIVGLNKIIQDNANSPLAAKAATMIEVLGRRKEIEEYLTKLQVTREEEEKIITVPESNTTPIAVAPPKAAVATPVAPAKLPTAPPKVVVPQIIKPIAKKDEFILQPDSNHAVLMILDKVDGMYVNEAKNAFTRYNNENYYGQGLAINKDVLDTEKNMQLLVIGKFANDSLALEYYTKIKRSAPREVSWLPATKYSFVIITNENLQLLKTNKDVLGYKKLLNTLYVGKF
jgi:outer membrane protein assembly factor BamD (BamD/ComL family)